MAKNISTKINLSALLGALTALLLFGIAVKTSHAIFVSAPTDPILTGDITTTEILDATINDIDIASSTQISILKIGQVTSGAVPFASGEKLNASTTALMFSASNSRFGISSSTPGATLSVHGTAIISGTSSFAGLQATGTAIFQNVTVNGVCNGCAGGSLIGGWHELGETILTTSSARVINVNNFPARNQLRITLRIIGGTDIQTGWCYNNTGCNSAGATPGYAYRRSANRGAFSNVNSNSLFQFNTSSTSPQFLDISVDGSTTTQKSGFALLVVASSSIPDIEEMWHNWNVSTSSITTVTFENAGGAQFPINSRATVYGKQN